PIAFEYCFARKMSSASLSRCLMRFQRGTESAIKMAMTASITSAPASVKPASGIVPPAATGVFLQVMIRHSVYSGPNRGAFEIDDARLSCRIGIIPKIFLYFLPGIVTACDRIDRHLPQISFIDK